MQQTLAQFLSPFVVFFGDIQQVDFAKTGMGLIQWRRDDCVGQIRLPGCAADAGVPDMSVEDAKGAGARTLIIGVAPIGGGIPPSWLEALTQAAAAGIDIVGGMHIRLESLVGLEAAAAHGNARLINARVPPASLSVASGRKRSGKRLLTVGTDCACGKKYTALALDRELRLRGIDSEFRATGQTGIMIAGKGIPIDAVVADFLAGAAEMLSPSAADEHWDVIEGQGGIFHPAYLQVTVGLIVGSQPDAFVVCHDPERSTMSGWPDFALPTIEQVIERTIQFGSLTNPIIRCVGISLNTSKLSSDARELTLEAFRDRTGLPCVDPLIDGVAPIVDFLI
jgi:uncharacterized NAD-dependent epimerase/dehydratase family protein